MERRQRQSILLECKFSQRLYHRCQTPVLEGRSVYWVFRESSQHQWFI
uniref:Uncharacterized protein n=1 Tax=Anguilla anguilla TaxID=7936 RepID=A0A0E9WVG0_ANGAN